MERNVEGQGSFLSKDHDRLLNIAAWAKYLAWVVLAVFSLWAAANFLAGMTQINLQMGQFGQQTLAFSDIFRHYPFTAVHMVFSAAGIFFKGVVYYLVLTGISLGLNMIVETDVNRRDKAEAAQ